MNLLEIKIILYKKIYFSAFAEFNFKNCSIFYYNIYYIFLDNPEKSSFRLLSDIKKYYV